jgi:RecA-family ATPase
MIDEDFCALDIRDPAARIALSAAINAMAMATDEKALMVALLSGFEALEPFDEGEAEDHLYRIATHRYGLSDDLATGIMGQGLNRSRERRAMNGHRRGSNTPKVEPLPPPKPLEWSDMAAWDAEPAPPPEYTVAGRVPKRQTMLFSGEGGGGKTTIGAQLSSASVLGRDWLGSLPEKGPAWIIEAEDEERVMRWRLERICQHYGVAFADLIKGGLRLMCLAGKDSVLGMRGKGDVIIATPLYKSLLTKAAIDKPRIIFIASSANVYAGNEISRTEVGQFVNLLTGLALAADGSTILASHPSVQGMNTGTGISGSTQWHNAVRARAYLKSVNPKDGEQPDKDLREIQFMKNQYGKCDDSIVLRWDNGIFKPIAGRTTLEKAAAEAKADDTFLDLLLRLDTQGRTVSHKPNAPTYAPTTFAKEPQAKERQLRKADFEGAMTRLFSAGKINVETYGRPSRPCWKIARA